MTADELRAFMAEHHEALAAVAAQAPPPPAEALAILRATNCPTVCSAPTSARRMAPSGTEAGRGRLSQRAAS